MECSFKWGWTGYKYKSKLYFRLLALLVLNKPFDRSNLLYPQHLEFLTISKFSEIDKF
jgi:hypothetical protein